MENNIYIEHGIYGNPYPNRPNCLTRRGEFRIILPVKLSMYLYKKYNTEHDQQPVEFTVGYTTNIVAVSVCHPSDQYSRRVGRKIVMNRIEEARTNPNFDITKYDWIYKERNDEQGIFLSYMQKKGRDKGTT